MPMHSQFNSDRSNREPSRRADRCTAFSWDCQNERQLPQAEQYECDETASTNVPDQPPRGRVITASFEELHKRGLSLPEVGPSLRRPAVKSYYLFTCGCH